MTWYNFHRYWSRDIEAFSMYPIKLTNFDPYGFLDLLILSGIWQNASSYICHKDGMFLCKKHLFYELISHRLRVLISIAKCVKNPHIHSLSKVPFALRVSYGSPKQYSIDQRVWFSSHSCLFLSDRSMVIEIFAKEWIHVWHFLHFQCNTLRLRMFHVLKLWEKRRFCC